MAKPNKQWCSECKEYTIHLKVKQRVWIRGKPLQGEAETYQCINAHNGKSGKKAA